MISISEKSECSGCFACYNACPVASIQMKQDEEGFYYPTIDEKKCINCGLCKKTCPILNNTKIEENVGKVFICQNKSEKTRIDSTSGGVFSAIAQCVIDRKGVVFGAEFGKNFLVQHGYCESAEELERFRGSKYVQSDVGNAYKKVKQFLDDNRWVLFSGTPCQVSGLNSYLGNKYEKLILMDIVCYSISSPGVWSQFLDHIEKNKNIKKDTIGKIKFRDKSKFGYDYTLMSFYDKQGKMLLSEGPESNQMLRSFVSNTSTRPSCYDCRFKGTDRESDFTAWDCYNIYQYDKELDDDKGSSHLMIHSAKGLAMMSDLSKYLNFKEVDAAKAISSEPAMIENALPSEMRGSFFSYYKAGNDVFDRFFKDTFRVKVERLLRQGLSAIGLYKKIKRKMKE